MIYLFTFNRWNKLPNIPVPRAFTSAVFVPGEGPILVGGRVSIGGWFDWKRLKDVYTIKFNSKREYGDCYNSSWDNLPQMLQGRLSPGISYFNQHVFVAGTIYSGHLDVECLRYPSENPETPQWTIVSYLNISPICPMGLVNYNRRLLLTSKINVYEI